MATTAELITQLEEAIASGARIVEYDDQKIEYKNVQEMLTALELLRRKAGTPGGDKLKFLIVRTKKGL